MVIQTNGAAADTSGATLFSIPTTTSPSAASADSFAQQLASALAGFLSQAGDASHFQIDVQAAPSQNSSARQFLVTLRDASASPAAAGTPAAASLLSSVAPSVIPTPLPPASNSASDPQPKRLANGKPVLNSADAYWATQPPAVQQLKDIHSEEARENMAHQLADAGYSIDVPIMVWGWDPLATMIVRKNEGFTWIPSAKMDPVRVAPGIDFPGLPRYDPDNPPEGSIKVSTDWAAGLEKTDGWLYDENGNPRP